MAIATFWLSISASSKMSHFPERAGHANEQATYLRSEQVHVPRLPILGRSFDNRGRSISQHDGTKLREERYWLIFISCEQLLNDSMTCNLSEYRYDDFPSLLSGGCPRKMGHTPWTLQGRVEFAEVIASYKDRRSPYSTIPLDIVRPIGKMHKLSEHLLVIHGPGIFFPTHRRSYRCRPRLGHLALRRRFHVMRLHKLPKQVCPAARPYRSQDRQH